MFALGGTALVSVCVGRQSAVPGSGIGGVLLQPVLTLADAKRTPCYLETHIEHDTRFYQRHGFEFISLAMMPSSDITIYAMLRQTHV
jgi:predicted GNAT family N-acyltransferase